MAMAMAMGLVSVSSMAHPPQHSQQLSFSRTETLTAAAAARPPSALSLSSSSTAAPLLQSLPFSFPSVYCGRGDKKTAKGKRFKHSFGNARPRDKKKGRGPPRVSAPPAPPKKDKFDDGEIIKIDIDD